MAPLFCTDDSEPVTQVFCPKTARHDGMTRGFETQSSTTEFVDERPTMPEATARDTVVDSMARPWWARMAMRLNATVDAIRTSLQPGSTWDATRIRLLESP